MNNKNTARIEKEREKKLGAFWGDACQGTTSCLFVSAALEDTQAP